MKKIAVITGASSGMGKEFVLQLPAWEGFDEIWVIAAAVKHWKRCSWRRSPPSSRCRTSMSTALPRPLS